MHLSQHKLCFRNRSIYNKRINLIYILSGRVFCSWSYWSNIGINLKPLTSCHMCSRGTVGSACQTRPARGSGSGWLTVLLSLTRTGVTRSQTEEKLRTKEWSGSQGNGMTIMRVSLPIVFSKITIFAKGRSWSSLRIRCCPNEICCEHKPCHSQVQKVHSHTLLKRNIWGSENW